MKDETYSKTESFFERLFYFNDNIDKQAQDFANKVISNEKPLDGLIKFRYNGNELMFVPRASLPIKNEFIKQYKAYQEKNKDIYSDYKEEDKVEIMEDFLIERGIYYLWATPLERVLDYLHCFHSTLYRKMEQAKEFVYND